MGGCCCCCASEGTERNSSPAYFHNVADDASMLLMKEIVPSKHRRKATSLVRIVCAQRAIHLPRYSPSSCTGSFICKTKYPVSEEREPLSSHLSTVSALSTGLLVDTNLDTSVPDTYRPPPAPIPFGPPPTPPSNQEIPGNKVEVALQTTNTNVVEDTNLGTKLKSLNSDGKAEINIELAASKETENENSEQLKMSAEPFVPPLQIEEDVCPTCLEEYDSANPKIITKCDHHFHLACILEWMERSDTCPVCDQEMVFSPLTQEGS